MFYILELKNLDYKYRIESIYYINKLIEKGTEELFWGLELYGKCESYSIDRIMYVKTILEANSIHSFMSYCK